MPSLRSQAGDMLDRNYSLRAATNSDAPLIWEHISRILGAYGIVADLHTTDRDLADIEAYYKDGGFYTLWHEESLVGTGAFKMLDSRCAELGRMYVSTEHRGKGLGRFLLAHMMAAATNKGASSFVLKTSSVLKEAIQLYTKAGFAIHDRQTCGNCDLTMTKDLRNSS